MIIANIETFPLRIPFKSGTQAAASAWGDKGLPVADSLLVKVTTDQGLEGWGETFGFRAVSSAQLAIDELIAPLCIGRDATQIGPLMLAVQRKLHVFGRSGPLFYGISAVDIALWDIAGKAASVPVYRLLGGSSSTDLPCYASLIRYSDPAVVRASVRRALDSGFSNLKLHEIELSAIRAAREEAGPDVEIMLDVNCPWTLLEARGRAEELKEIQLKWLEEPILPPETTTASRHCEKCAVYQSQQERTRRRLWISNGSLRLKLWTSSSRALQKWEASASCVKSFPPRRYATSP